MERYEQDPVGFELDGAWITRAISRIIRFENHPLCDHLEVNYGGEHPFAYAMDEDSFKSLEDCGWDAVTFEAASPQMQEFTVDLHLENLEGELLRWYVDHP